ncbi:unnamed protein product [marine sediment metagenome]|uniref:Class I SAM-dependent methyltransferase n=1 Tax=marine sediment metagenome TaxID=412755 RepID=X0RTS1_9ZZZZ
MLIDLIKGSNGCISKIAEIGVWRSKTMQRVLKACSDVITEYWAIDQWLPIPMPRGTRRERHIPAQEWEKQHLRACYLMAQWFPQIRVVRADASDVAGIFPDGYFDLVFLDADHHYDDVLRNIQEWLPKVRKDGVLSGHDYGERFEGVKRAVDEYFKGSAEITDAEVWIKRV